MSRNASKQLPRLRRVANSTALILTATFSVMAFETANAQAALGTPFIGRTLLSFHSAQNTRSGGPETTTTFGVVYGHRFGQQEAPSNVNLMVRASARPLEGVDSGVLDFSATIGMSRTFEDVPHLSVAASTGVGMMAWSDDAAKTGRAHLSIPANAGLAYALRIRSATFAPFAMGSLARYDLRTSLNDERVSRETGWDTYVTTGASLRLREVVLTSSRISGEHGMPYSSRWTFAAGISF